jgi:hypothetical protein
VTVQLNPVTYVSSTSVTHVSSLNNARKGVAKVQTAAFASLHEPYVIGNVNRERHPPMILEFEPSVARIPQGSPETFATPFLPSGRATRPWQHGLPEIF